MGELLRLAALSGRSADSSTRATKYTCQCRTVCPAVWPLFTPPLKGVSPSGESSFLKVVTGLSIRVIRSPMNFLARWPEPRNMFGAVNINLRHRNVGPLLNQSW